MKYISKGIVLDEETWKAFNAAREVHGSYNKALRHILSAGGVFGKGLADVADLQRRMDASQEVMRDHMDRSANIPERDRKPPKKLLASESTDITPLLWKSNPPQKPLQGTIKVERRNGKTSATVNITSRSAKK